MNLNHLPTEVKELADFIIEYPGVELQGHNLQMFIKYKEEIKAYIGKTCDYLS